MPRRGYSDPPTLHPTHTHTTMHAPPSPGIAWMWHLDPPTQNFLMIRPPPPQNFWGPSVGKVWIFSGTTHFPENQYFCEPIPVNQLFHWRVWNVIALIVEIQYHISVIYFFHSLPFPGITRCGKMFWRQKEWSTMYVLSVERRLT